MKLTTPVVALCASLLPNLWSSEVLGYSIETTNNGLNGTPESKHGSLNDVGNTFWLWWEVIYQIGDTALNIHASLEGYVTLEWQDKSRTSLDNKRIDNLRFSIDTQVLETDYCSANAWAWIQIFWDFGGYDIQNGIHDMISDSHIPAKYSESWYSWTPTITAAIECNTDINNYLSTSITYSWEYPLIQSEWIQDENIEAAIEWTLGRYSIALLAGIDSQYYPDTSVFSGYPLSHTEWVDPYIGAEIWVAIWKKWQLFFKFEDYTSSDSITEFALGYTHTY